MINYISKENAEKDSPVPSNEWKEKNEIHKKNDISFYLKSDSSFKNFEVIKIFDNGHVILRTEESIQANKRGMLLLKLESILKENIDEAITLWLEPVGDKSKLRGLRGIELK